jgi:hypothetical protein
MLSNAGMANSRGDDDSRFAPSLRLQLALWLGLACDAAVRTKHANGFSHTDAATLCHCCDRESHRCFLGYDTYQIEGIKIYKTGVWDLQFFFLRIFLGDFEKFRKVTISVVMSARPSVRMEQLGFPHWTDFHEI